MLESALGGTEEKIARMLSHCTGSSQSLRHKTTPTDSTGNWNWTYSATAAARGFHVQLSYCTEQRDLADSGLGLRLQNLLVS